MSVLQRPIEQYETVATWRDGLSKQWGGDPLAEEPEKLTALTEFCEFVAEEPDAIVHKCFRVRKSDGETVISSKWRTIYADKIKEFRTRAGGNMEARRTAAAVQSFLIHNGVMIQV